ncbi:hypothetical protein VNO77_08161 [Canavalia gladiata]|uniref:Uncharacterized protein n=1 Tax=Canavalia gladiata TaxID=3824 RepID=A0AAN9QWH4_CANGL
MSQGQAFVRRLTISPSRLVQMTRQRDRLCKVPMRFLFSDFNEEEDPLFVINKDIIISIVAFLFSFLHFESYESGCRLAIGESQEMEFIVVKSSEIQSLSFKQTKSAVSTHKSYGFLVKWNMSQTLGNLQTNKLLHNKLTVNQKFPLLNVKGYAIRNHKKAGTKASAVGPTAGAPEVLGFCLYQLVNASGVQGLLVDISQNRSLISGDYRFLYVLLVAIK